VKWAYTNQKENTATYLKKDSQKHKIRVKDGKQIQKFTQD